MSPPIHVPPFVDDDVSDDNRVTASWFNGVQNKLYGDLPTAKDFGAAGNNVATDTTYYQQLLDSGSLDVTPLNVTGYKCGALTIPAGIKSIAGQRLYQAAANANLLTATSLTRLRVTKCDFYGVAGTVVASSNTGLRLVSCSGVQLDTLYFEGWRIYPLWSNGVTDSVYTNLLGKGNSDGFRFTSCNNVVVNGASLYSPQTLASTFIVGFALDSTDGGNTICTNMTFAGCNVKGYINAQAYLIHAGIRVSINGGVLDDVLIGIGITQFNSGDFLQDISIDGVEINCTTTVGDTSIGSVGITAFGFSSTVLAQNITISDCNVRAANLVVASQSADRGGIEAQFVRGLTLDENNITGGAANGYAFYRRIQDLTLIGGSISDVAVFGGENNGIRFGEGSTWMAANGEVRDVKLRSLGVGIRLGITAAVACTITRSGMTATLTKTAHGFLAGDWIRIAGVTFAAPADGYYLGAFQVATVPTDDTLTYTMAGTPTNASAAGSPTVQGSYDGLFINNIKYEDVTTEIANPSFAVVDGVRAYIAGDKSPWVGDTAQMTITNASAVVIASFRGGRLGQRVLFNFTDANTTVARGSGIKTASGADITSAARLSVIGVCTDATVGANVFEFLATSTAS